MQFTWHGTARALDAALDSDLPPEESRDRLRDVLIRNLYTDDEGGVLEHARAVAGAEWLSTYVVGCTHSNPHIHPPSPYQSAIPCPSATPMFIRHPHIYPPPPCPSAIPMRVPIPMHVP